MLPRPGLVVHDHRLAEDGGELLGDLPGTRVGPPARAIGHDQGDRLGRIGIGRMDGLDDDADRQQRRQAEQGTTVSTFR
jgi:hypothetical protein